MSRTAVMHPDVKNRIIERAREIFAKFGFKKTTMNEIAGSMFKTKGSIYYYYKSKEEIFEAIVEKEWNILQGELHKAVRMEEKPQKQMRAYVLTRARFMQNLANFYAALREDYLKNYAFIEKLREKEIQTEREMIKGLLEEGIRKGVFVMNDVALASLAIVTALKGLEFTWATEKNLPEIEKDTDILLEILFNGLNKR
jgi:AcrR family transcriptional regulator